MKRILSFLSITLLLCTAAARGQQKNPQDSTRQKQRNHYRRTLQVDSAKAEQVTRIQENYKAGMKTVASDAGLAPEQRKQQIKALMAEKNKKLAEILTPVQQEKIIPTTERQPSKP